MSIVFEDHCFPRIVVHLCKEIIILEGSVDFHHVRVNGGPVSNALNVELQPQMFLIILDVEGVPEGEENRFSVSVFIADNGASLVQFQNGSSLMDSLLD